MKDEKQIEEMARDIFEPRVAIDGIDIAFAAVHGADRDAEGHFMRIARHLYKKGYRKSEAFSQPHENGGEWIEHSHYNFEGGYSGANYECSVCHFDDCYEETPYCPNCGAKMKGE